MRPSHISYAVLGSLLATAFFLQWAPSPAPSARSPRTVDDYANGGTVVMKGYVIDAPERGTSRVTVSVEMLKTGMRTVTARGNVQVNLQRGVPLPRYGEEVIATGTLRSAAELDDALANFLRVRNVESILDRASIEPLGSNRGYRLFTALYALREHIETLITAILPEPHASLLMGLLAGSRGSMPRSLADDFKATGLTHIVAISGYNITMLITILGTLLFWLPQRWRFVPSVLLVVGFTILTGASASAVRAAIMGILGLVAINTGRVKHSRLAVLWTASAMVLWNPALLWYDAGFQLSFLALLGIMEIPPLLRPYLQWVPQCLGLRETLCLTLSAQMMASPWILYLFGQLSLIAPVSNLVVPALVPAATISGGVATIGAALSPTFGRLLAWIPWLALQGIVATAEFLGSVPYAAVHLEGLSAVWIATYYVCVVAWVVTSGSGRSSCAAPSTEPSLSPQALVARSGIHAR